MLSASTSNQPAELIGSRIPICRRLPPKRAILIADKPANKVRIGCYAVKDQSLFESGPTPTVTQSAELVASRVSKETCFPPGGTKLVPDGSLDGVSSRRVDIDGEDTIAGIAATIPQSAIESNCSLSGAGCAVPTAVAAITIAVKSAATIFRNIFISAPTCARISRDY